MSAPAPLPDPPRPPEGLLDRWTLALTRLALRHPIAVFLSVLVLAATSWSVASRLKVRGDFVELLPTRSETAQRFRATGARKGGSGSTLIVMVRSPDAKANQRAVDAIEQRLRELPAALAASVEHGPGESRTFYDKYKWLFASRRELALIECELDRARARQLPGYLDIDDPCEVVIDHDLAKDPPAESWADLGDAPKPAGAPVPAATRKPDTEGSIIQRFEREMQSRAEDLDRYPTGYFRNQDGTLFSIMVRSPAAGMGEYSTDELMHRVQGLVAEARAGQYHPELRVGYAGDIPNAIAERDALVEDITLVSGLATVLLLASVVVFFRSFLSLGHIALCVGTGCGVAFGVAMLAFGRLNAATSFLGAIIAGNGINYSIMYLARYRERRGTGDGIEAALLETAVTVRKGTWLSTLAVSGAYGSLMLTSFRGFSEFGLIGCVGMLACEIVTFASLPASIALLDRARARRQGRAAQTRPVRAPIAGILSRLSERFPRAILVVAALLCVAAIVPMHAYFQDPWEYDFNKLKSKSTKERGAGKWSNASNEVFSSRGSPQLMLADDISQVRDVARQVVERDRQVTGGKFVRQVETVYDAIGGPPEEVRKKLALLAKIREHLDKSMRRLSGHDLELARQWRPPEYLRVLTPQDLPPLVQLRWSEADGRMGTAVYVSLHRNISQSRGENLLKIAEILESVKLPNGSVVPNASRATVFAEMIRSMERDGPRATLVAFLVVVIVTLMVTRRAATVAAVLGTLIGGVVYTVGGAAWLDTRLNFLNFIAIPLVFGISIEYAINLYERVRAHGGNVAEAVRSAGGAVFLCSLTTILGYSSLLIADNLALQSFGRYSLAGEIACIVTALVVLPAALQLQHRRNRARGP